MALDDGYVNADYLRKAAERIASFKRLTYERMAITTGDTVLDVGCGPGMDTVPLAKLVGANGQVFGIDTDCTMLKDADCYARKSGVSGRILHQIASALSLPFEDNAIDSCRAERLLQVLPPEKEQRVVSELVRVTRPGGRVVLADTDWGSASVDFSDSELERRLLHFFATQMRPHGFAGRRLYALCRDAGLSDITVEPIAMVQHTLDETPFGDWLTDTAQKAGVISNDEAQRWMGELKERSANGSYYSSATMIIVTGQKKAGD